MLSKPNVEHRYCVKHMDANFRKIFRGLDYKKRLWAAAGTGIMKSLEAIMKELKEFNEKAYDWVISHDPKGLVRALFSTHTKLDALQNNISESFNSYLREGRDMPILSMLEWIRRQIMKRIHVKYSGM